MIYQFVFIFYHGMRLIFILVVIGHASADYDCLCNYNVEKGVFASDSGTSTNLGYLYEFDCKQLVKRQQLQDGWSAIAFEHKVGYVQKDDQTNIQVCSGDPPTADMVTTSQPIQRMTLENDTTASAAPTTVNVITSTSPSNPGSTTSNNSVHICPQVARQAALTDSAVLIVNYAEGKCYLFEHTHLAWSSSEKQCNQTGGHLVTVENAKENNELFEYVKTYGHYAWLGLSDRSSEQNFTWSSGENVSYTNWFPGSNSTSYHSTADCVVMDFVTGQWKDIICSNRYAHICEFPSTPGVNGNTGTVPSVNVDGNVQQCPTSTILAASSNKHIILGQYGQACYELHNGNKVSWTSAESTCKHNGGHLAYIGNADEQNFIETFVARHSPDEAAWIGLHDKNNESNFEWTSGEPVTYTNWISNHNATSHETKDCVALLPNFAGKWDEVSCGSSGFFFNSATGTHYFICQYKAVTHTSSIVIG